MVSHANMSRLLKQMSLIVSTELQQIAIDLVERLDEDKLVKFIRLKDEFRQMGLNVQQSQQQQQISHHQSQQQQQPISQQKYSSIANKLTLANSKTFFVNLLSLSRTVIPCKNQTVEKSTVELRYQIRIPRHSKRLIRKILGA